MNIMLAASLAAIAIILGFMGLVLALIRNDLNEDDQYQEGLPR